MAEREQSCATSAFSSAVEAPLRIITTKPNTLKLHATPHYPELKITQAFTSVLKLSSKTTPQTILTIYLTVPKSPDSVKDPREAQHVLSQCPLIRFKNLLISKGARTSSFKRDAHWT